MKQIKFKHLICKIYENYIFKINILMKLAIIRLGFVCVCKQLQIVRNVDEY